MPIYGKLYEENNDQGDRTRKPVDRKREFLFEQLGKETNFQEAKTQQHLICQDE